ncbi:UNKNOWN [Stylonychia lemnae]|uniref:Uncharacterized protein n=1 Tax=Stylonychia lemnae TaxID=5949 RepID=A0A078A312_STYLE|nr:UNKNOWN [Stylonychia lemnae]|eukprot:CDW75159.1 UNKNOWN [Stylonychia lemnae]
MVWSFLAILQSYLVFYLYFSYQSAYNPSSIKEQFLFEISHQGKVKQVEVNVILFFVQVILSLIVACIHSLINLPANCYILYKTIQNQQSKINSIPIEATIFYTIAKISAIVALIIYAIAFSFLVLTVPLDNTLITFEIVILVIIVLVTTIQTLPNYLYRKYLQTSMA